MLESPVDEQGINWSMGEYGIVLVKQQVKLIVVRVGFMYMSFFFFFFPKQLSPYDNLLLCQPVSSPLPLR